MKGESCYSSYFSISVKPVTKQESYTLLLFLTILELRISVVSYANLKTLIVLV
uniref:Uncharacterized protein n=1 Tax=Anguilla anguilla TaxID=7936 RepID=A0A0E9XFD9_ANGAN